MKQERYGKCHLCGQINYLTFEHLPPEKAHNSKPAHAITGDALTKHISGVKKPWDYSGVKYKNMQRGMGGYTLCAACNNNTGAWYAQEYVKFARTIAYILNTEVDLEKAGSIRFEFEGTYPLRIIKQVLAMFMSTMPAGFLDKHVDLREFILNKNSRNFNTDKYRISMYCMKTHTNGWSGITAMLYSNEIKTVAYMDLYPLGFVFEVDPKGENFEYTLDISQLATDYDYDTKGTLLLNVNILERNNFFPCDFRSKEQLEKDIENSKKQSINETIIELDSLGIKKEAYIEVIEAYENSQISCGEFTLKIEEIKNDNI